MRGEEGGRGELPPRGDEVPPAPVVPVAPALRSELVVLLLVVPFSVFSVITNELDSFSSLKLMNL